MSSLRELLAAHAPILLLDAASARVQVGWLDGIPAQTNGSATFGQWHVSQAESGVALFEGVSRLGRDIDAAGAFVFCNGPGSILGIRTAAMAIRTWSVLRERPVYAYSSLALVAHALGRPDVGVIADARRDSWHRFQLGHTLQRVAQAELSGNLVMPEGFRNWTTLPPGVEIVPYRLSDALPRVLDQDLFHRTADPDAFLHEQPSYLTWTPQIHRAPGESPPPRSSVAG